MTVANRVVYHRIGEAAKELGVNRMTLRRWEQRGLIPPARRIRSDNGEHWRAYTDEEIAAIRALITTDGQGRPTIPNPAPRRRRQRRTIITPE